MKKIHYSVGLEAIREPSFEEGASLEEGVSGRKQLDRYDIKYGANRIEHANNRSQKDEDYAG